MSVYSRINGLLEVLTHGSYVYVQACQFASGAVWLLMLLSLEWLVGAPPVAACSLAVCSNSLN